MHVRVELFEHETLRIGDALRSPDPWARRFEDHDFEALARFNDVTGQRYFRTGHRRITATQHVGYVEVGRLAIEVLPKADRGARRDTPTRPWRDGLLAMLSAATGLRLHSPDRASVGARASRLIDLVALRFVEECEKLLREGLLRGYREDEANLGVFVGRLLAAQNARVNAARDDRFFVRRVTYDHNVLANRVLREALAVIDALGVDEAIEQRAKTCVAAFPEVTRGPVNTESIARLGPTRALSRYEDALTLARMLLERVAPDFRSGPSPVFAMLFDMNLLWERYVAHALRRVVPPGLRVRTQRSARFWEPYGSAPRTVRPDLVVDDPATGRVLFVADTKWRRCDDGVPTDDELKQMFVYHSLFAAPRSLLLYPTVAPTRGQHGHFSGHGFECHTAHLSLLDGAQWSDAHLRAQLAAAAFSAVGPSDG